MAASAAAPRRVLKASSPPVQLATRLAKCRRYWRNPVHVAPCSAHVRTWRRAGGRPRLVVSDREALTPSRPAGSSSRPTGPSWPRRGRRAGSAGRPRRGSGQVKKGRGYFRTRGSLADFGRVDRCRAAIHRPSSFLHPLRTVPTLGCRYGSLPLRGLEGAARRHPKGVA